MEENVLKEIKFKHGKISILRSSKKDKAQGIIGWILFIMVMILIMSEKHDM
ncbi:hypothetical protein [Ligilactobacillus saerimneri]|uniref:hypothetical protein n=1 Tax=Ligilactobacillus saerimneri TaxID=228229 RepID=UPI0002EE4680|nr:hypothetical protein [Ligilactobacillus saerimneri]